MIRYDPAKRAATLAARGLDFAEVGGVFAETNVTWIDDRVEYGEERLITVGTLHGRMVVVAWTWRDGDRHIISLRKANDREQRRFAHRLD